VKSISHILVLTVVTSAFITRASEPVPAPELPAHVLHNFSSRAGGSTQVFAKSVGGTSFTRNPKFWLRGLNGLTAIHAGYGPGATAITPWHVLGANHWKPDVGSKLYFCDSQDHTVARTVVAGTEIRPDIKSDIWLALLDEALPPSIMPIALMPTGWADLLQAPGLPVAAMNQASAMGCAKLISLHQSVNGWFRYGYVYQTPLASELPGLRFEPMRKGDSGYPIVTIVETNLVLLGHLTIETGSNFLSPAYSHYLEDIQVAIASLGTNHLASQEKLTLVDLSGFRSAPAPRESH